MTGGTMVFLSVGSGTTNVSDINFIPIAGMSYDVEYEITALTNARVDVRLGGAVGTQHSTTGVKSETLTAVDATPFQIRFTEDTGAGDTLTIEYMRISVATSSLSLITADWYTNMFDFKAAHNCTVLVGGANNEDAFGLRFESAFYTPKARLKGNLRASSYETEIEEHIDSLNRKEIDYFSQRKYRALQVQNVPEYLTDWFSILRGFSQIYIDGAEYMVEGDLEIRYNRFCDRSKIEMTVGEKRQDLVNENKKGLIAITDINNVLLRIFDEKETIIFIDGDEIALKG